MKYIILLLCALCLPLSAQNLLEKTQAQKSAEYIDSAQVEMIRTFERKLCFLYSMVAKPDTAQSILDSFGDKAVVILERYIKGRDFVISIDPTAASRIPAPDLTIFRPNQDGTVTFVPPPAPEPTPEPAPPAE